MAFCWLADDGPLIVVFGSSLPSSKKKQQRCQVGPPLTKLSGSAHEQELQCSPFKTLCLGSIRMGNAIGKPCY